MIEMPDIARDAEVANYLKRSKKTIQNWKSLRRFCDGIVLNSGDFNMAKLRAWISRGGYLKERGK